MDAIQDKTDQSISASCNFLVFIMVGVRVMTVFRDSHNISVEIVLPSSSSWKK